MACSATPPSSTQDTLRRCDELLAPERQLVDFVGGMTCARMDALDGLPVGALRQTEHLALGGIGPPADEADALGLLDSLVLSVGFLDLLLGGSLETAVNVHESRHDHPSRWVRPSVGPPTRARN